jgi:endo-1,4-beta-xylanase
MHPNSPRLTRREALRLGLQLAGQGVVLNAWPTLTAEAEASGSMVLKVAGQRRGCQIGVAASKASLQDPDVAQFVARNFNLLTASGMKWDAIHPGPESYDFAEADWNVSFAESNGMRVHGHNLCWDAGNPAWLKSVLNKSNAEQSLTAHVTTVMKRYQGRVDSWDVVNEPVVSWPGRSDGLYPGIWLDLLGPQYIDVAFHAAALADPKALRIINIHHVEQGTLDDELARSRAIVLLRQLVARGVPLQAVGFESHLDAAQPLGGGSFVEFIKQIRALGLGVLITELDVMENRKQGDSRNWDETVAKYYGDYVTQMLTVAEPRFVIFWSVDDRWAIGRRVQGLTYDHGKPRLNYNAALRALQQNA